MDNITKSTLKRLSGEIGTKEHEVRDPQFPGLSVRIRKSGAVWTLRSRLVGKQSTWRIGSIIDDALSDPKEARRRATEAKRLLGRGIDPSDYLKAEEQCGAVVRTGDPSVDGWLWPEAVDAFLKAKAANRSPNTIIDYRKTLNAPGLRGKWDKRPLKSLTARDIRIVTEEVTANGHPAQANHILRVVKSLFSWATQENDSGVADVVPPTLTVKPKQHRHQRGYVPTLEELGKLFWNLNDASFHPSVRLAAALLVLTVQRRETVVSAKKEHFLPYAQKEGWGMWRMEADPDLLLDRHHAVPLPPLTWGVVQAAAMCAGSSPYLFPQTRLRREGEEGRGYLSGKAVYEALQAAGAGELTPHDLRRALATHGPDHLGIRDDDLKKVLNHGTGSDVTTRHYAFHQSMPWKVEVMEKWEGWLIRLMMQQAPQTGRWPDFLPARAFGDVPCWHTEERGKVLKLG